MSADRSRRRELLVTVANAFTELASLEPETSSNDMYTSQRLPPDVGSRTVFARACRAIPGAKRQGKMWVVSRTTWERARTPKRAEMARNRDELRNVLGLARRAA